MTSVQIAAGAYQNSRAYLSSSTDFACRELSYGRLLHMHEQKFTKNLLFSIVMFWEIKHLENNLMNPQQRTKT